MSVYLPLGTCDVRPWRLSDIDSLVACANNRKIWINLRDRFPHPYTVRNARDFIDDVRGQRPETTFAIVVDGQAVGEFEQVHRDAEAVEVGAPRPGNTIALPRSRRMRATTSRRSSTILRLLAMVILTWRNSWCRSRAGRSGRPPPGRR